MSTPTRAPDVDKTSDTAAPTRDVPLGTQQPDAQDMAFASLLDLFIETHEDVSLDEPDRTELAERLHKAMVSIARYRWEGTDQALTAARVAVGDASAKLIAVGREHALDTLRWSYVRATVKPRPIRPTRRQSRQKTSTSA